MRKIKIALVGALLLLPIIVEDGYAHGLVTVKDCTRANLPYNEELYREDIMGINQAALLFAEGNPHYKMGDLASYMVNVYLNQPVELAHCLRDLGVNPASVAQLTPFAYSAITYDKANLEGYSHDFLGEVPPPSEALVQDTLPSAPYHPDVRLGQAQAFPPSTDAAQASDLPAKILEPAPDHLQVSLEQVFIAMAIVVFAIGIVLFVPLSRKGGRVVSIPGNYP